MTKTKSFKLRKLLSKANPSGSEADLKSIEQKDQVAPHVLNRGWGKVEIVHKDEDFIVVNKPAGLAVHGGEGVKSDLISLMRTQEGSPNLELAHRIDQATSGLCVIVKENTLARPLSTALKNGEKKYLLVVKGMPNWKNYICELDIHGKKSKTIFDLIKSSSEYSLLSANIFTGRKHQIRIHISKLGFPIIGDRKYGDFKFNRMFLKEHRDKNLYLHCAELHFTHGGKKHDVVSKLPAHFEDLISQDA